MNPRLVVRTKAPVRLTFAITLLIFVLNSCQHLAYSKVICDDSGARCRIVCVPPDDRHCDYPVEKDVDSDNAGLPGDIEGLPDPSPEPPSPTPDTPDTPAVSPPESPGSEDTTSTSKSGLSRGGAFAIAFGGSLAVIGAILQLRRKPKADAAGGADDLSGMASASGLEPESTVANRNGGMEDVDLSENV